MKVASHQFSPFEDLYIHTTHIHTSCITILHGPHGVCTLNYFYAQLERITLCGSYNYIYTYFIYQHLYSAIYPPFLIKNTYVLLVCVQKGFFGKITWVHCGNANSQTT